ncbi:MAG: hypothetical protein AAGF74_01850 [Pseudomonadota bacterium]
MLATGVRLPVAFAFAAANVDNLLMMLALTPTGGRRHTNVAGLIAQGMLVAVAVAGAYSLFSRLKDNAERTLARVEWLGPVLMICAGLHSP